MVALQREYAYNSGSALRRSASVSCLPNSMHHEPRPHTTSLALPRTYSVHDLGLGTEPHAYPGGRYGPSGLVQYKRDYDLFGDYWYDRHFDVSPMQWPYYSHYTPSHRYHTSPDYHSMWYSNGPYHWPKFSYKYAYGHYLDTPYTRRQGDSDLERPWWRPDRPTNYAIGDLKNAIKLQRENRLSYKTLDKYWLSPYSNERRLWSYRNPTYF